ncbi:Protein fyv10, partial [Neolecta irregularis DAH-3]
MTTKEPGVINPDSHILIDQSLIRLPYETLRKNFRNSQRITEKEIQIVTATLAELSDFAPAEQQAEKIDGLMTRLRNLRGKLVSIQKSDDLMLSRTEARLSHLHETESFEGVQDKKYERWSETRLDRLIVDYMMRAGMKESGRQLASTRGLEALVDLEIFGQCKVIEDSLRNGNTAKCLEWCAENKQMLRKSRSSLEFELRLQEYIELVRKSQHLKAIEHSKKYLISQVDMHLEEILQAAALLAFSPETAFQPYKSFYSSSRWSHLAEAFLETFHSLYSLPTDPLLHIAMSAGLSALKTPICYSQTKSDEPAHHCPICSTEFNKLAQKLPFAHHLRSHIDNDPVKLPNGRIFGVNRLLEYAQKMGLPDGTFRDPGTGEDF